MKLVTMLNEIFKEEKPMVTEEELRELNKRNQERVKKMIEQMGRKWLCHPDNRVPRKKEEPKNAVH